MKRFRVRVATKTYQESGPDLLRPAANAVHAFANLMGKRGTGFFLRRNPPGDNTDWTDWNGPLKRGEVLQKVDAFADNAVDAAKMQVGRLTNGQPDAKAELLVVDVRTVDYGVNVGAELVAQLIHEQFPGANLLGYSCKRYNSSTDPSVGWSDHAWRDAIDAVTDTDHNDEVTDWCVRMAREGCMGAVQQFIGSSNGRVYNYTSPDYRANLGGPSSHLWHVHCSYRQHYGANPHCS